MDELEQYDILLEEQAFPFEEKPSSCTRRTRRHGVGLYDEWVRKSFAALVELSQGRYAKVKWGDACRSHSLSHRLRTLRSVIGGALALSWGVRVVDAATGRRRAAAPNGCPARTNPAQSPAPSGGGPVATAAYGRGEEPLRSASRCRKRGRGVCARLSRRCAPRTGSRPSRARAARARAASVSART